jgi:hypothetical protein
LKRPASLALTVLMTWERPVALAWRMTSCAAGESWSDQFLKSPTHDHRT